MKLPIYQVDAFTDKLFGGNPAAVMPLEGWLADDILQTIAAENNLAETAYFIKTEIGYHLRWFTPTTEVELCGHATLATAFVLFNDLGFEGSVIQFETLSGILTVTKNGDWLNLNFPIDQFQIAVPPPALVESLNVSIAEVYKGKTDYLVILNSEDEVRNIELDIINLSTIPARGIIVSAPGDEVDFVSRFFAPQSGIDEDPVTGSAHTTLIPYWAQRLDKKALTAKQLSAREGFLQCELVDDRVNIAGQARLYMKGEVYIDL